MSIATLGAQDSLVPFLGACPKNRRILVFMGEYVHVYISFASSHLISNFPLAIDSPRALQCIVSIGG
jgi:hypothetical protein